jgi:tRNA(Ile)-lysidine synthase
MEGFYPGKPETSGSDHFYIKTRMQKRFTEYLRTVCGCSQDARHLLAVSGGVDSVAMAYLFRNSGLRFSIAHCNFQLRGDESDCDQAFVEDLAGFLGVPCYVKKFETEDYALREGLSIQVAARDLRYEWFREVAETGKMNHVAIGHNSDDVAETFFINLSRGTGIHGLTGIKPSNGIFIRPLLFASRADILEFAKVNNIRWREDSSNDTNKYSETPSDIL